MSTDATVDRGILDAVRELRVAVARLGEVGQAQHVDTQTKLAVLASQMNTTIAVRTDLDAQTREISRVAHAVDTLKEQRADIETRLRPVESTRSQALLIAAIGSMVMAGLVSLLMRGAGR